MKNKVLGAIGENYAVNYLQCNGYQIVCQNWRHRHLEVDIIAHKDQFLVFIEVKTRSNKLTGTPDITINFKKQERLIRAAEHYLTENHLKDEIRFDVLSVYGNSPQNFEFELIENAFR